MNRRFPSFFFSFCGLSLVYLMPTQASPQKDLDQAALFFDAKEYSQAQKIEEQLLEDTLSSWQREVVTYNLATVLIAQGKNAEGLSQLMKPSLSGSFSPLLQANSAQNKTAALLNEALLAQQDLKTLPKKVLKLFEETKVALKITLAADCRLQKAAGAKNCVPSPMLSALYLFIQQQSLTALQQVQLSERQALSFEEQLSYFLVSLTPLIEHLNLLKNDFMPSDLQQPYRDFFGQLMHPSVELSQVLFLNLDKKDKEIHSKLLLIQQVFKESLHALQKIAWIEASQHLQLCRQESESLLKFLIEKQPAAALVQRLMHFYQQLSLKTTSAELNWLLLSYNQQALLSKFAAPSKTIKNAQFYLEKGLTHFKKNKVALALFYRELAYYFMRLTQKELTLTSQFTPKKELQNLIEDQQQAIRLQKIYLKIYDQENLKEINPLVLLIQQQLIEALPHFYTHTYQWQLEKFQTMGASASTCQQHPWDEVFPLFDKGFQAAKEALIKDKVLLLKQQEAKSFLKQALNLLKKPLNSFNHSCLDNQETDQRKATDQKDQANKQKVPSQSHSSPPSQTQPQAPFNQVLRQLIDMNQDDTLPVIAKPIKGGAEKPW